MGVTIDKFSESDEFGPVTKFEREVKTPMPGESEENRQVVYSIGDYLVKVSKVSTRGWSVTRYEGEDDIDKMQPGVYYEDEQQAHEVAREMVEEVANE